VAAAYIIIIEDVISSVIFQSYGISGEYKLWIMLGTCGILGPMSYLRKTRLLTVVAAGSVVTYIFFAVSVVCAAVFDFNGRGSRRQGIIYHRPTMEDFFADVSIMCIAFSCQSNFFWIFNELHNPSSKKMIEVTNKSVVISALFYVVVGIFGAMAFGHRVEGNLLNNMRGHWLLELSSFLMMVSTVLSFPLVMTPCIISLDSFLFFHKLSVRFSDYIHPIPPSRFALEIFCVLCAAFIVCYQSTEVEIFLSVTGALSGFTVGYILPSVFFLKVTPVGSPLRTQSKWLLFLSSIIALLSVLAILYSSSHLASSAVQTSPDPLASVILPDQEGERDLPLKERSVVYVAEAEQEEKEEEEGNASFLELNADLAAEDDYEVMENPIVDHFLPNPEANDDAGDENLYENNGQPPGDEQAQNQPPTEEQASTEPAVSTAPRPDVDPRPSPPSIISATAAEATLGVLLNPTT